MNAIPKNLRKDLVSDPFYKTCARAGYHGHQCEGRVTFEHAMIFAANQIQEKWAIIPLCEKAHAVGPFQDGGDFNKKINEWIALNRATDQEILSICKARDYFRYRGLLNQIFGAYNSGKVCAQPVEIGRDSVLIDYEYRGDNSELFHMVGERS